MSSSTENHDLAALKKYLKVGALRNTADETYIAYLGVNCSPDDREAFLEVLSTECIANQHRKLSEQEAIKVGVFSILDGTTVASNGRPPLLSVLLDEQAYQDGNTATYEYYLGDRRTRDEEQEFRQRLAFVKSMFDCPVDELRAQATAEYMLGSIEHEEDDSEPESEESEEESEPESSEESSSESEEEDNRRRRRQSASKKSTSNKRSSHHHRR